MANHKTVFALSSSIREMCRCHVWATSGSFTFRENVTDLSEAKAALRRVLERIRRRHPEIKMVGVWERQSRGAWHAHWVSSSFIDVKWLRSVAVASGFGPQMLLQTVNRVPGYRGQGVDRAVRYLTKYLTKDLDGVEPGTRLVWYHGAGSRSCSVRFSWSGGMAKLFRLGRGIYSEVFGALSWETQRAATGVIVRMGWEMLSPDQQAYMLEHSDCVRRWWFGSEYAEFVPF